MASEVSRPLFKMGAISVTRKAWQVLDEARADLGELLHSHQYGDWRDTANAEVDANHEALRVRTSVHTEHLLESTGKRVRIVTYLRAEKTRIIALEEWGTVAEYLELDH